MAARLGDAPKTHNVGGLFGKHYLDRVGPEVTRRVNRLLMDYDGPRYPDWTPPSQKELQGDLAFVEKLVTRTIPALTKEAA